MMMLVLLKSLCIEVSTGKSASLLVLLPQITLEDMPRKEESWLLIMLIQISL